MLKLGVVDCLARGKIGKRLVTVDAIGTGPRLLVGIARTLGHEAELILCEKVLKNPEITEKYDLLLVSGMSPDIPSMTKVLRSSRSRIIIAGGPSCVDYDYLLSQGFDYVIWGEGEISLPKLLKVVDENGDVSSVPNLIYRDKSTIVRNPGPNYAEDHLLWTFDPSVESIKKYPGWWGARIYVEVVRGCSNFFRPTLRLANGKKCIGCDICRSGALNNRLNCPVSIPPGCGYCSVPALYGPARSRPYDKITKEIKRLIDIGVTRIVLSAPDFLDYGRDWLVKPNPLTDPRYPPPNLEAIDLLLKSIFSIDEVCKGEVHILVENIKPNLVNDDVARILGHYLRGSTIHIGVETGEEKHHLSLGRPSRVHEVIKAVELLVKEGLKPYIYVIHGLPGESKATIRETVRIVEKLHTLGVEKITLYRFRPLKGTAFEGFHPPPPAVKSMTAKRLYYLVKELNMKSKKKMIGQIVKAIGVGTRQRYIVAYTLPHGPVLFIEGNKSLIGKIFRAKITGIFTERVLLAKVIDILGQRKP